MNKYIFSICCCAVILFSACKKDNTDNSSAVPEFFASNAQNSPEYNVIAGTAEGVSEPRDLDFDPITNKLWVLNKGNRGSDVVIITDAGMGSQSQEKRADSHRGHFMIDATAIAFSNINTFATVQEVQNTVGNNVSTFMGPTLWPADLGVFATAHQSNWDPGRPLGSHFDMLHQSPYSMGIAHDFDNAFWLTDGFNGNLVMYDFVDDHGPGGDNHSDGRVHRYTEASFTRVGDVPSHLILDKQSGWLYYCDTDGGRIMRLNTNSGSKMRDLSVPSTAGEPLAEYWEMTGVEIEVFTEGLVRPSGIDVKNGRLFVSDYSNGQIHAYDLTTKERLASIETGETGITGIVVGTDDKIYFTNYLTDKVVKVMPK